MRIDDGASCLDCGYTLHGITEPRCPECGRPFDLDDPRTFDVGRRLHPAWLMGAVVPTLMGITVIVGFRIIIAAQGLHKMSLWHGGQRVTGAGAASAATLAQLGSSIATGTFILSGVTFLYCCPLAVICWIRSDWRTGVVAGACAIVCAISGLLAFELGMIIAGI